MKNDYTKIEKIAKEIRNNSGNIKGIFANLYFMSKDEMVNELGKDYYKSNVSVLDMFKISKRILENYLPEIEFVYSIEGCDYINEDELEDFYDEGLRSIILTWNNKNKYGSGNSSMDGLTKEGISFITKAIELGMGIDLSHANEKTFYGIMEVIKMNQDKNPICYASHSNSKRLCYVDRNLTDKQLITLKLMGGLVGIVSYKGFVYLNDFDSVRQRKAYLEHIRYIVSIVGIDKVMISTDDMRFNSDFDKKYNYTSIYNYSTIYNDLKEDLLKFFKEEDVEKIMYNNAYGVIKKLNVATCEKNLKRNRGIK